MCVDDPAPKSAALRALTCVHGVSGVGIRAVRDELTVILGNRERGQAVSQCLLPTERECAAQTDCEQPQELRHELHSAASQVRSDAERTNGHGTSLGPEHSPEP